MKEQIIDLLVKYPIAWIAVLVLAPIAIRRRYRRFERATGHTNDAKSRSLLLVGFTVAAVILWAFLEYS